MSGVGLPPVLKEYPLCVLQVEGEASLTVEISAESQGPLYVASWPFDGIPSITREHVRGLAVPRCYHSLGILST